MKDIVAAFIFFTRLPLWKLKAFQLPAGHFRRVINYWPVTGWITASVMVLVLWGASSVLPVSVSIILAMLSRMLLTGALHEDGLADFFDGLGGGSTRERILAIMKDSHIGTYGVISLILYCLLFFLLCLEINLPTACLMLLAGDPLCKWIGSQVTFFLPYARTEESSKSKVIYEKASVQSSVISIFFGLLPFVLLLDYRFYPAILFPVVTFLILIKIIKKKLNGYTGDCCGALFLLCELSFYLGVLILHHSDFL
jgi:adenosylcobinamide-GDP ribazoletransferase